MKDGEHQKGEEGLGELRSAVKSAEESLMKSHRALAEMEARLTWSQSRRRLLLPDLNAGPRGKKGGV